MDGMYGYVDSTTGQVAIEPQFDLARKFSEGLAVVGLKPEDERGFIEALLQGALPLHLGCIDMSGEFVIQAKYAAIGPFNEGLAAARRWPFKDAEDTDLFGYIDKTGNFVIKPQFSSAKPFCGGWADVVFHRCRARVNRDGKIFLEPRGRTGPRSK
jgi:WG containing repeat